MEIFSIGSEVMIGDFVGVVTAVTIRSNSYAIYEVAWWNGSARNSAWVDRCELKLKEKQPVTTIGFFGGLT